MFCSLVPNVQSSGLHTPLFCQGHAHCKGRPFHGSAYFLMLLSRLKSLQNVFLRACIFRVGSPNWTCCNLKEGQLPIPCLKRL